MSEVHSEVTAALGVAPDQVTTIASPASPGEGNWVGAPAGWSDADGAWLTWRERTSEGRGGRVVVARLRDGVHAEEMASIERETFGAASLERSALVRRPRGGWRLYVSCSTPDSKHWWIEAIDADDLAGLPSGTRTVCLPGSDKMAVKDPIVMITPERWLMFVIEHPLAPVGQEDRMATSVWTSPDGLHWQRARTLMAPVTGGWDSRGTRFCDVVSLDPLVVVYDGRTSAEENFREATAVATGSLIGGVVPAPGEWPVRWPEGDGAFRYLTHLDLADGTRRWYAEVGSPDGSHRLVTWA